MMLEHSRELSQPHQKASVFGSNSLTAPRSTASLSECSQSRMRPHERNTITRARARFSARFFSHSQAFRNRPLWFLLGHPAFSNSLRLYPFCSSSPFAFGECLCLNNPVGNWPWPARRCDLKSGVFLVCGVQENGTAPFGLASCEMDSGHWALRSLSLPGPFKPSCLVRTL